MSINIKKPSVSIILYIIVNSLFIAKYSARIIPGIYIYLSMGVMLLHYILITYLIPYSLQYRKNNNMYCIILLSVIIGMVILQYSINPYSIQVDRWSALYFPIKNLLNGIYPYIAQTHLGGNASPFPVWQIFHIPFYLLGNVGLSVFFAIVVFLWSIYHLWGYRKMLFAASLLLISPAIWYEVVVRSDFITNILLLTTIINLFIQKISVDWINKHTWSLGIVIALFASTRLITLIPFGLLLLPFYFKLRTLNKILLPTVFASTFLLTFLPFAIWDWQDFFYHQNNPWTLQTRQGNLSDFIIYIPIATILAHMWKNNILHYYKYVSIMLLTFIAVTMLHIMVISGNWDLFSSTYDITYYDSILPFAIVTIILNGYYTKENTYIYSE